MKVIILCGISGAGKSTWTEKFLTENPNFIRLNRDSIRECLIPNHVRTWYSRSDTKELEKIVSSIVYDMTDISGHYDRDIIFDNTNVDLHVMQTLLKILSREYPDAEISIKLFDINLETAQNRAFKRDYLNISDVDGQESFDYSGLPEVTYIEKQYDKYQQTKQWLVDNHADKLI